MRTPGPTLRELTLHFRKFGAVEAIFLRPARLAPVMSVAEVQAEPGRGLIGDRRSLKTSSGDVAQKREVTLFQAEHLPVLAAWLGIPSLEAGRLRRNLVISGINLAALRSPWPGTLLEWSIGAEVVLQITGTCDPCSRMETELGHGGYNALRGHGGVTARILVGGTICIGDAVRLRQSSLNGHVDSHE